jgi:hypothetical protein
LLNGFCREALDFACLAFKKGDLLFVFSLLAFELGNFTAVLGDCSGMLCSLRFNLLAGETANFVIKRDG